MIGRNSEDVTVTISERDWEQVRIDAAISALQGVMESGKLGMVLELDPKIIAVQAVRVADALVDELKNGSGEF
jgi:hypothetical protein